MNTKSNKGKTNQNVATKKSGERLVNSPVDNISEHIIGTEYLEHLMSIVESSYDAIISKSLDGIIITWNKAAEKMLGYSIDEVYGKNISLIIPQAYILEDKQILERILNNEVVESYETVRAKKNGEVFYASLTVSPLKDSGGVIIGVSKIIRDNTSRRKIEVELIEANKQLAFQNEDKEKRSTELRAANQELEFQNQEKEKRAAELILANRELLFQNKEKEKRAAELRIVNIELAFESNEKEKRAKELMIANQQLAFQNEEKEKRALEKEKRAEELVIANRELAFQNKEKEKRAAELGLANIELAFQNEEKEKRASELIIANKELVIQNEEKEKRAEEREKRAEELIIANKELAYQFKEKEKRADELIIANQELAFQNKEKENRAEELITANNEVVERTAQLEAANKELEAFSYSVSHDLRAPLRAIHGYSKMLKESYESHLDAEANRMMNNIMDKAKKMGQLIDELLRFSRIGRKDFVMMNIPMDAMVRNICEELKNEQGQRNIEFRIKELLPARADNTTIKQVWLNLISNSIKYTKQKDRAIIEISSKSKDGEIIYKVKDNGAGFDMRYVDKLFGVFQRLHSEEEFEGNGVGLALVNRIISKHGGRVWAEGKVNEGAIFYFTLNKSS